MPITVFFENLFLHYINMNFQVVEIIGGGGGKQYMFATPIFSLGRLPAILVLDQLRDLMRRDNVTYAFILSKKKSEYVHSLRSEF